MPHGYIGLGQMGNAMCRRLLDQGVEVVVVDRDPEAVDRLTANGATAGTSAAELADRCDVISICVPADDHVRSVMNDPDGIASSLREGLTVLIHSTIHPDTMRELHESGAATGIDVHDACVAGGDTAARAGELVLFVSNLDTMAAGARATVNLMGSKVLDTGPAGSGAAVKIGVNVMTYAQQAALVAAFDLVRAQGASTDALTEAWRHNGQFPEVIERFSALAKMPPDTVAQMADYLGNVVGIAQKDLNLALSLAESSERGPSAVVAALRDHARTTFGLPPS